jgi:hypothetical protein
MGDGKFKPGNPGKPKGAVTKSTKLVKDVFAEVFTALQDGGSADLEIWARNNTTEFYKLASRLIPMQVEENGRQIISIKID